jgi:superfamily I DNA and RNA helicase
MAIEFIPTKTDLASKPQLESILRRVRQQNSARNGVLYYAWPQLKNYSDILCSGDLAFLTADGGLKLVGFTASADDTKVQQKHDEISELFGLVEAQLTKSIALRKKRRLVVEIEPILFAPNSQIQISDDEATVISSEDELIEKLSSAASVELSDGQIDEVRSILEGAKALSRPKPRNLIADAEQDIGQAFAELEEVIANFDARQRSVAMTALLGPQRIRGLAGTGKTVILAMKAALTHAHDPNAQILVTYYTRSLKDTVERLIVKFYRHFSEGEPNWSKIHVRHGWGRQNLPGVYRDACNRTSVSPLSFGDAKGHADPFGYVCRKLVETGRVTPFYDMILVDEGQDFPDSFYHLCFFLAKGSRDEKQIVWAYDELQNVFDVTVRAPDVLFGTDTDGEPRISLVRALPEGADTNDHVLQKSYRNQRDVLVLAHSIGFGVYGNTVQMLENRNHWEDVGYDVLEGTFEVGTDVVVERPARNSPSKLNTPEDVPLLAMASFEKMDEEVAACVSLIQEFIRRGLRPHDILVIALDDRYARDYLNRVSKQLALVDLMPNNMLGGGYDEPPFIVEDSITLSSVYRAKGNEAAAVIVVGTDGAVLRTRQGRNRLFVALTRTKGWLRLLGCNNKQYQQLKDEIASVNKNTPKIVFNMPNMTELNTIQRDLEEKHARMAEAKTKFEKLKDEYKLTDDDLQSLIEDDEF